MDKHGSKVDNPIKIVSTRVKLCIEYGLFMVLINDIHQHLSERYLYANDVFVGLLPCLALVYKTIKNVKGLSKDLLKRVYLTAY